MIASMITLTTPSQIAAQRSSDLTMPSSAIGTRSAHHAARQEHEEVNQQPPCQEQADGERSERKGAARNLPHDAFQILVRRAGRRSASPDLGQRRRVCWFASQTRNKTLGLLRRQRTVSGCGGRSG